MNKSFISPQPTKENCWRSAILIGDNDKCYKFALGKSLLDFAKQNKSFVTLKELSKKYADYICEHIKENPTQGTTRKGPGPVLNACKDYVQDKISYDQLIETTAYKNEWIVLKKFHLIKGGFLPTKFFEKTGKYKKHKKHKKGITLTDDLFKLKESSQFNNLFHETEGRWNLVEKSWHLNMSRHLITIDYDRQQELLVAKRSSDLRRVAVTSARKGLNGYQKGKCFYCFKKISIEKKTVDLSDVDHFFPIKLEKRKLLKNLNGVWNLVLACKNCNRGPHGKFELIPEIQYLERLSERNNYLIESHDPLRQTLVMQTGKTAQQRHHFLNEKNKIAVENFIHQKWKPQQEYDTGF